MVTSPRLKRGAVHVRHTDCTDRAAAERPRAEIRPSRYKQRTSRHGTPRSDVRNRENRLTSGTSTLSAGRSDRRRDVSAGLESQPAWTVPLGPYRLDRPQVDISGIAPAIIVFAITFVMRPVSPITARHHRHRHQQNQPPTHRQPHHRSRPQLLAQTEKRPGRWPGRSVTDDATQV